MPAAANGGPSGQLMRTQGRVQVRRSVRDTPSVASAAQISSAHAAATPASTAPRIAR